MRREDSGVGWGEGEGELDTLHKQNIGHNDVPHCFEGGPCLLVCLQRLAFFELVSSSSSSGNSGGKPNSSISLCSLSAQACTRGDTVVT